MMMQTFDDTKRCCPCRIGGAIILVFLMSMFWMPDGADAASSRISRQKTFASPEDGVTAMVEAMKANDVKALSAIFGPAGMQSISFGDAVTDQAVQEAFLAAYQENNRLEKAGDTKAVLHTGNNDWPFPLPLVKKGQAWYFDAKAGKEEILDRRIGRNELSAVQVCLAYVDAQKEYALGDHDRDGFYEYAQKLVSDPGQKNGLYWETPEGEKPSPLGPAIAMATREGYKKMSGDLSATGSPLPYHGYYYKILKAQGKNTPGGAYDYVANGKMLGGFALVAYPAKYGQSGIMTFIVHMDGIVYQKNLGKNSTQAAEALTLFDPDKTWKMAEYGHAVN
jgi:hypothetical protein